MSFEFKEGDIVKIEGVLEKSDCDDYPFRLYYGNRDWLSFDKAGRYRSTDKNPTLQLVSRPVKKITKWNWVYKDKHNTFCVTPSKYENEDAVCNRAHGLTGCKVIQKIDSTAEEFEV